MDRDLLAELDSIKEEAETRHGREDPGVTVTVLSRFEEHYAAFRHSLEQVLGAGDGA